MLCTLLPLAFAATSMAQPIVVDGDLSDWVAPQGEAVDPCNEILPLCKSGFDFVRVLTYYDVLEDKLYFGIDIMDVVDGACNGVAGPGVAGDADGDGDPCVDGNLVECAIEQDQECVGPDEFYLVKIDTNFNQSFSDPVDLRVVFRANQASLENGLGVPIPGWPVHAVLGQAGRSATACHCEDLYPGVYNPDTEDIEFVVENYSQLDDIPVCFYLDFFAGSLVDGPPEDTIDDIIGIAIGEPGLNVVKRVRNLTEGGAFNNVGVPAKPGDEIEFEVTVCNTGNIFLDPVLLVDELPADYENPQVLQGAGCQFTGNRLDCDLGRLEIGDCVVVRYKAKLLAGLPTKIVKNTAIATSLPPGQGPDPGLCRPDPIQDQDSARVAILEIECDKKVSVDGGVTWADTGHAVPGQDVYFMVTVTNNSMVTFDPVTVTDELPSEYENPGIVQGSCGVSENTVECSVGPMDPGTQAVVIYKATLKATADPNVDVVNTAVVVADFTFQDVTVSVTTDCSAMVDVLEPSVDCSKKVSLDGVTFANSVSAVDCQTVWFRVRIANTGEGDLYDITLVDELPGEYSNAMIVQGAGCQVVGNRIECTGLGPIPQGAGPIEVIYKAEFGGTAPGTVTNTAFVTAVPRFGPTGLPGDPVQTNCSADVNTLIADIECAKFASLIDGGFKTAIPAVPGQTIYFRVDITNTGTAPFYNVALQDVLPPECFANVELISGPGCSVVGNTIACNLGILDPAATAMVKFKATLIATDGICPNGVAVTGYPGSEANPGCETPSQCSVDIDVLFPALECDKNVSLDGVTFSNSVAAQPGDMIWFEVIISIPAEGEACFLNVALEDELPPNYTNVQIVQGTSCGVVANKVSCPDLAPAGFCPQDPPIRVVYKAILDNAVPNEMIFNTAYVTGIPGILGVPGNEGTPIETDPCSASVQAVDVAITCDKVADLSQVAEGQKIKFTVTITNTSQSPVVIDEVELLDQLSVGLKDIVVLQPASGCTVNQGARTVHCSDLGPLDPGASHVVIVQATVDDPDATVGNSAQVTGRVDFDDDGSIDAEVVPEDPCEVIVPVVTPCIECLKEASLDGVNWAPSVGAIPGQTVFFRVRVTNCGEIPLRATLDDTVPLLTGIQILQGSCTVGGSVIHCDLGEIAPQDEVTVIFSGKVPDNATPQTVVNTAFVTGEPGPVGNPGLPTTGNCAGTIEVLEIDFTCSKQVSLDGVTFADAVEAVPGQKVWFRVVVENPGQVDLKITMTDVLAGVFESLQTAEPVCNIAANTIECVFDLAQGAMKTILYTADLKLDAAPGTYLNTVDLTAESGPPANPGATRTKTNACQAAVVVLRPELECDKGVSLNGVNFGSFLQTIPGDHLYFRVRVTNNGTAPLRNVHVSDLLPTDCYEGVITTSTECNAVGNAIECDLGELAAGDSIDVFYEADVKQEPAEACPNTAHVTADTGTDQNPGEPLETECSALVVTIFLEIPTLTPLGLLALVLALGGTLLVWRRRLHRA